MSLKSCAPNNLYNLTHTRLFVFCSLFAYEQPEHHFGLRYRDLSMYGHWEWTYGWVTVTRQVYAHLEWIFGPTLPQ